MKYLIALVLSILVPVSASADFSVSFLSNSYEEGAGLRTFDVFVTPNTPAFATGAFNMDLNFTSSGVFSGVHSISEPGLYFSNSVTSYVGWSSGTVGGFSSIIDGTMSPSLPGAAVARFTVDISGLAVGNHDFSYDLTMEDTGFPTGSYTSSGTGSISISAVPEPSSMALLGLIGLGGVAGRKLAKRKRKNAEPATAA